MKTQNLSIGKTAPFIVLLLLAFFVQSVNAQQSNSKTPDVNKKRKSQRENTKTPSNNVSTKKDKEKGKVEDYKPGNNEFSNKSDNVAHEDQNKKQPANFEPKQKAGINHNPALHGIKPHQQAHMLPRHKNDWHKPPKPRISFRVLPRKAIWVELDGESFFLYKRHFYKASPFGYYRVKPPRYVQVLPHGTQLLIVNGVPMYNYYGVHFVKTHFGYEVFI